MYNLLMLASVVGLADSDISAAQFKYTEVIQGKRKGVKSRDGWETIAPILPIHRLSECPRNNESFIFDQSCEVTRNTASNLGNTYTCSYFRQKCDFNGTVEVVCRGYRRSCDPLNNCQETYDSCQVNNKTQQERAPEPGIPSKVFLECIPWIQPLRDQCKADFVNCKTHWRFDPATDHLTSCSIDCTQSDMWCFNYTRLCEKQGMDVFNMPHRHQITIDPDRTNCSLTVFRRRMNEDMRWENEEWTKDEKTGLPKQGVMHLDLVPYKDVFHHDEGWEKCVEEVQVPYNNDCNQFVYYLLTALRDVPYEPLSHNFTKGIINEFLAKWDMGYQILCKQECFYHLIKFSRRCWEYIPLQRMYPGADFRTVELMFRNLTRIGCYITDPPAVKYEEDWKNARNSCSVFFDVEHPITKPHFKEISRECVGETRERACSDKCNAALHNISQRFGCCLGSIVYQYKVAKGWLDLMNFGDQPIIGRILMCNTTLTERCEIPRIEALSIEVITYLMWIIGAIMAVICIVMIISFYWQHEHEPLQKKFYHF